MPFEVRENRGRPGFVSELMAVGMVACGLFATGCTQTPGVPVANPTSAPSTHPSLVTIVPSAAPDVTASPKSAATASPSAVTAGDGRFKLSIASDSAYQVEAPGAMTEEVQTLKGGAQMHHLHTDKKGDVLFDVAWVQLDPQVAGLPPAQLLDGTARAMTQGDPNAKAAARALKSSPDLDAIVVLQPGPGGSTLQHCILVAQGRLYQLMVTPQPGKHAAQQDVDRFFDSFMLLSAARK